MDIIAIRTTEEFLKKSPKNTAIVHLHGGQTYETKLIYKIIEPTVTNFQPLIVIDVQVEGEDLAIIPVAHISHIIIKGPEKEMKVGFFIEKTS
ncbi:MAG: hypothetical protein JW867_06475 [Candidatus Omnitrophica bacterium]|nr:hypothetical protein [Candidatus Omnitrophota bacterium]